MFRNYIIIIILFPSRFPFDHRTPTAYALVTAFITISYVPYINPIMAVDLLFLGCCIYISEFFKDLQGEAITLDYSMLYKNEEKDSDKFRENLISFVDQHNRVIGLVKKMENVFGEIFIIQYVGSIFSICSQAYLSTLVRDKY